MKSGAVVLVVSLVLPACSRDAGQAPEVHETGAPAAPRDAAAAPAAGVSQQGRVVVLDGDTLFLPGSTELAPGAEPAIAYAAQLVGVGDGPTVIVAAPGADMARGLRLAQATAEALSYIGGVPFNRLEPRGVRDSLAGRRITLTPQPAG